ncbi:MAG: helix-turn-helix transcriptional regulator [Verrucomicrobiae bacterium]|nr:helix-turn-helix transcriptional regulator [Verrucomicrobiae bacterium]
MASLAPEAILGRITRKREAREPRYFSSQISQARRFFLGLGAGGARGVAVLSGGVEHCRPDYLIDRAGFRCPVIEFVARGAGRLEMGGRDHDLARGVVFIYGPHVPHRISADPRTPPVKYFVGLAGDGAAGLLQEAELVPGAVLRAAHAEQVQDIFEELIRLGLGDHARRARLCAVAAQYLILKLSRDAAPRGSTEAPARATYERCRRHIEEHHREVRTLREVATACHVDLAYMCRLFQRFGRESPFQYLQHLRMNRAAEMLQEGATVKAVAVELGFSEPCNFSRAFARVFGVAPGFLHPRGGA